MRDEKAWKWVGEHQLGYDIWEKKYRHNNETFDQWLDRVSGGNSDVRKLIEEKKFLFGGRILANRGLNNSGVKSTLSNCYVLSVDDSIESIYKCCSDIARTYSYGGGVGIDISKLRPAGAFVNNSAKSTTGAVSFMKTFDVVTGTICQNGRRGALMISIDINHPDVEEFINIKANTDQITNANISVRVSDEFMNAVETDSDYLLTWPCNSDLSSSRYCSMWPAEYNVLTKVGDAYIKKVKAKQLFQKLAENNWNYAEPGILYWDRIDHWNMMDKNNEFQYAGVNPCAKFKFILIF
jgi:ribonucleoside-diphosphate reductase alpha chain